MKKLAFLLVIAVLASVTGIGVLVTDIRELEAKLSETQNALEIVSSEAKAKENELASQAETLITQLETAKADASKAEAESKAKMDGMTSQVETLTAQLETLKRMPWRLELKQRQRKVNCKRSWMRRKLPWKLFRQKLPPK